MTSCFFFFFQAEDGIRDVAVTGVQTCALPISTASSGENPSTWCFSLSIKLRGMSNGKATFWCPVALKRRSSACWMRSEEHTSELQSRLHLVCRLLLEKKNRASATAVEDLHSNDYNELEITIDDHSNH